jgi:hypothetical protein
MIRCENGATGDYVKLTFGKHQPRAMVLWRLFWRLF